MKSININGEILRDSLKVFQNDINAHNLKNGDTLRVFIDSVGGCIATGILMYYVLDELKKQGVLIETVNDGKLYSSAIIPYLAGDIKLWNEDKNAESLIHNVSVKISDDLTINNIDETLQREKEDLLEHSKTLEEIYKKNGVSDFALSKLTDEGDFIINDFETAKQHGLADEQLGKQSMFKGITNITKLFDNKKNTKFEFNNQRTYLNFCEEKNLILTNKQTINMETPPLPSNEGMLGEIKNMLENMNNRLEEQTNNYNSMRNEIEQMKTNKPSNEIEEEFIEEEFTETDALNFATKNFSKVINKKNGTMALKHKGSGSMMNVDKELLIEKFKEEEEEPKNQAPIQVTVPAPTITNKVYQNKAADKRQSKEVEELAHMSNLFKKHNFLKK